MRMLSNLAAAHDAEDSGDSSSFAEQLKSTESVAEKVIELKKAEARANARGPWKRQRRVATVHAGKDRNCR